MVLFVKAESARDMYQVGIGAHVSQSEASLPSVYDAYQH